MTFLSSFYLMLLSTCILLCANKHGWMDGTTGLVLSWTVKRCHVIAGVEPRTAIRAVHRTLSWPGQTYDDRLQQIRRFITSYTTIDNCLHQIDDCLQQIRRLIVSDWQRSTTLQQIQRLITSHTTINNCLQQIRRLTSLRFTVWTSLQSRVVLTTVQLNHVTDTHKLILIFCICLCVWFISDDYTFSVILRLHYTSVNDLCKGVSTLSPTTYDLLDNLYCVTTTTTHYSKYGGSRRDFTND